MKIINKSIAAGCVVIACGAMTARLQAADNSDKVRLTPYSADQILNGEFPGRKASPTVLETFDTNGFAAERLYNVPAPGVHPRVLFAPEDLPRIRQQLRDTEAGRALMDALRKKVADGLEKPGSPVNDCYRKLTHGDDSGLTAFFEEFKLHPAAGSWSNPVLAGLEDKALLVLLDSDETQGREVAAAAVALAKWMEPQILAASKAPGGDDFWRQVRTVCGNGPAFGLIYDFAQPFMDAAQTATMRRVIAEATSGKYVLGMDLPRHWRNWNFIGMAEEFPVLALAIEGEDGYDSRILKRGAEVARDYINFGISDQGIAKEAVGYHTGGMGHLNLLMLALANRGENLFTSERYRRQFEDWLIWAQQPFGGGWQSSGDLGTFPPAYETVQTMKFFYPQNERIDYVLQNHPVVRNGQGIQFSLLALLTPADAKRNADGSLVNYHQAADFHLPDSLFDPQRGYLFARSGWSADAASLQFVCRNDTVFVSHDDADRGTFYFTALGQPWSVANFRETEGKYANTVAIDGMGEGYAATPGKWLGVCDTPSATFGVTDLKYCYDWFWVKWPMIMPESEFQTKPWLWVGFGEHRQRLAPRYSKLKWERDPLPMVADYYSGYLAGDPGMWDEDTWVRRAPFNPVQRAFRTAGLVRGQRDYALIVDDIQKDDAEHLYEWHMNVPVNLEVAELRGNGIMLCPIQTNRQTGADAMSDYRGAGRPLPAAGTPLLWVCALNVNQPGLPTRQPSPALETFEYLKHDDSHQFYLRSTGLGKRIVFPSRSVAPDYVVLLFPLKRGEPLPETKWSDDRKHLTISWQGQRDEYTFKKGRDGRTRFKLARAGVQLCEIK